MKENQCKISLQSLFFFLSKHTPPLVTASHPSIGLWIAFKPSCFIYLKRYLYPGNNFQSKIILVHRNSPGVSCAGIQCQNLSDRQISEVWSSAVESWQGGPLLIIPTTLMLPTLIPPKLMFCIYCHMYMLIYTDV